MNAQTFSRKHLAGLALVAFGPALVACNIVDDEPPGPGADEEAWACFDAAQEIQANCEFPASFHTNISIDETIISIDDPGAGVQLGPNGWLFNADASADWVVSGQVDQECGIACVLCEPGSSPCVAMADDDSIACLTCIPTEATPEIIAACKGFVEACQAPDDGELDSTGGSDNGGDDDGLDTTDGEAPGPVHSDGGTDALDCEGWTADLDQGVTLGPNGNIRIDPGLVESLVMRAGEQITDCDGTRLEYTADGFLKVKRTNERSLLAALGVVRGDVLYAVNGRRQNTAAALMDSLAPFLSPNGAPSQTSVTVRKGASGQAPMELRIGVY